LAPLNLLANQEQEINRDLSVANVIDKIGHIETPLTGKRQQE